MIEIKKTVAKVKNNYIAQCEVWDEEEEKRYFVVAQLGDLLYATFDGDYLEYTKGLSDKKPTMVEGDNYMWFSEENTRFAKYYEECFAMAESRENSGYIARKYSHLKKSKGNIEYEIVYKKSKDVFTCGPVGTIYEIKFRLKDSGKELYVCLDDTFMTIYTLSEKSIIDSMENEEYGEPVEQFEDFSKAKNSQYYDLYLEVEKLKDGLYEEDGETQNLK